MNGHLSPGRPRRFGWRASAVGLAMALVASACGDATAEGEDRSVDVVVTTSIWADVVTNVACDGGVDVKTVIPPGGDPHAREPSLADRGRMDNAALVVANGLLLEEGLEDTLEAVADGGTPVFRIGQHADTIEYGFEADHDEAEHSDEVDHDHEGDDPHIWFDPMRVSAVLADLGDELVAHAGMSAASIEDCVRDYRRELAIVDDEIAEMVASYQPGSARGARRGH